MRSSWSSSSRRTLKIVRLSIFISHVRSHWAHARNISLWPSKLTPESVSVCSTLLQTIRLMSRRTRPNASVEDHRLMKINKRHEYDINKVYCILFLMNLFVVQWRRRWASCRTSCRTTWWCSPCRCWRTTPPSPPTTTCRSSRSVSYPQSPTTFKCLDVSNVDCHSILTF